MNDLHALLGIICVLRYQALLTKTDVRTHDKYYKIFDEMIREKTLLTEGADTKIHINKINECFTENYEWPAVLLDEIKKLL